MSQHSEPRRKLPLRRRLLFLAVWCAVVSTAAWSAWRIVVTVRTDAPLTGELTELDVWTFYYPKLKFSGALSDANSDETWDILFLGGSVLEQIAESLKPEDLENFAPTGRRVRLYNLTNAAHTSRDSLLKLRLLKQRRFDLIVVYHGINDARMNCCAAEDFRNDYTHCDWYDGMARRVEARQITFSGLILDAAAQLIPNGEPTAELAAMGREIKTPPAFRANLSEVISIARTNCQAKVLVPTFASLLPDNYSREAFERGRLGYAKGDYEMVAESWGEPDAVRQAIRAHNAIVRELGSEPMEEVHILDLARAFQNRPAWFCDPCHLSPEGCREFIKRITDAIGDQVGR